MNKKILFFRLLIILVMWVYPNIFWGKKNTLSPMEYGLNHCISGIQRYYVLQDVHNDAAKMDYGVDYTGIDTLDIEIPRDAEPLLLTDFTDFGGVVMYVKNQQKNMTLFQKIQKLEPINVTWEELIKGKRTDRQQDGLIIVEDQELWVKKRTGYDYGHTRRDILLVKDGQIRNEVISSYRTTSSKPKFSWCEINSKLKQIKNLIFNRDTTSTYITNVLFIANQNDVEIQNVTINTPLADDLYGDAAICITNCTNVSIKDVIINGTYSQNNKFGYGITMNNVWNISFDNLKGSGNWGIFGNNNVNTARLDNCDINRFDIHCYGKDVFFKNCTFRDLYNQFSSVYGIISFDHCKFLDFIPILFETSYNAYTGFDLSFKDCTWQMKQGHNYLIQAGNPFGGENEREELKEKCWPNLNISNMKVVVSETVDELYLYGCRTKPRTDVKIGYINNVKVNNMRVVNNEDHLINTKIYLSDKVIGFKKRITTNVFLK